MTLATLALFAAPVVSLNFGTFAMNLMATGFAVAWVPLALFGPRNTVAFSLAGLLGVFLLMLSGGLGATWGTLAIAGALITSLGMPYRTRV